MKGNIIILLMSFFVVYSSCGKKVSGSGWYSSVSEGISSNISAYNYNLDTTTAAYFSNLTYYPTNNNGCCGYIAMTMLLSYCDYVYDDAFIESNFEKRPVILSEYELTSIPVSPGTFDYTSINHFNGNRYNYTNGTYLFNEFYNDNPNCFMSYLYYFTYTHTSSALLAWIAGHEYQTNGDIVHDTLLAYLNYKESYLAGDYCLYGYDIDGDGNWSSQSQFDEAYNNNNFDFLTFVKSIIDAGYPVLVGGYRDYLEGHMAIVYAYDGDTLIANDGNGNTIYNFTEYYPKIMTAYTIIPANKQTIRNMSSAYMYRYTGYTSYIDYYHWNLVSHSHLYGAKRQCSNICHRQTCYCGYNNDEMHNFMLLGGNTYLCRDCSYVAILNGESLSFEDMSDLKDYCIECLFQIEEDFLWEVNNNEE